jgi:hypothetical protein
MEQPLFGLHEPAQLFVEGTVSSPQFVCAEPGRTFGHGVERRRG